MQLWIERCTVLKRHFIHATFARTVAALAIMILLSVLVGALAVQAVHIPKFEIRNSKLVLSTVEASAASPPQPTSLTAFHRSGQTFVTWTERTDLSGERYHVYRHTSPITSANLAQATRLTQTWGALGEGSSIFWSERSREPPITPNYVIQNLGTPLSDTTGLFVWTTHEDGTFYYAVTTVQGGTENVTDFGPGNTAGPIAEAVADSQPVKVWQAASGRGFVFTQYLDYSRYNPTFGVSQGTAAQQYAFNYGVTLPSDVACGGSLPDSLPGNVYLEGWGRRYSNDDVTPWNYCVVFIVPDDPNQTWYYGHSASYDYRLGGTASSGPIVNFTEERILRAIYDTLRDPTFRLDANRIYVYGHSMGGSGALALGMRYPNVFAATYSSEPMTNYQTSALWLSDTEWKWGTVASNLPIENRGPGDWADHLAGYYGSRVWDWQNHQQQLVSRIGDDMAHISLAHGTLDDVVIAWSTQGQPAYEPFYRGRRAFSGATEAADHTWLGYSGLGPNVQDYNYMGPFYGWTAVRDESLPGLAYASGSSSVPPPGAGASYNLNLEWSASWYNWDSAPIDTTDEWRISLSTTDGSTQTVDVTPRRLQTFSIIPGDAYAWENCRVGDNGLVASGTVIADAEGLITVPAFQVTVGGNRLILRPGAGGPTVTPTPTPTPTATPTPTPTGTPPSTRRQFPDTTDGIHVFNDQLAGWDMTEAQFQFAATHYAGTQKMIRSDTRHLRSYNPNFLVLHYRLGEGLGYRTTDTSCHPTGGYLQIIEGDNWVQEWPGEAGVQNSWFFPYAGADRVLQCTWGWYLMELADPGWRNYWMGGVLRQLAANENDGLFADSFSVPNYLGAETFNPDLPAYDPAFESAWARRIEDFIDYVQAQFGGQYYFIPNVGYWVTTRDPTNYSQANGVMIEGFSEWSPGSPFDLADWHLQMNRILGLTNQGKVLILQSYVDETDVEDRIFVLANYLLVKGVHSFINLDLGLAPEWFPEYGIPIGSPVDPLPTDIDSYLDPSGLYRRDYSNGLALVNPGTTTRTIDLGGTYYLATPSGGGWVPEDGGTSAWTVTYAPVTSVTLAPNRGAILLVRPCDLPGDLDRDGDVDVADIMQVASRWRCHCGDGCYNLLYDLDHDCDIDIVDIMKVAAHWGETCGRQ